MLKLVVLTPVPLAITVMFRLPQAFLPRLTQLQSHPCLALWGRLSLGRILVVAWFTVTIWERFRLTQAQVLPSPPVTVVQRLQQHTLRLVVCSPLVRWLSSLIPQAPLGPFLPLWTQRQCGIF